jgi:hypothetical protein
MFGWLFLMVDRLSKEWLDYCKEHGGGLESTFNWLSELMAEDDKEDGVNKW